MIKKPDFKWDDSTGTATCTLIDTKGRKYKGIAICCEDDLDMKSEKTGMEIAYRRALTQYLMFIKKNEINPKLDILINTYNEMAQSKNFNINSYEAKYLKKTIGELQETKKIITQDIKDEYINLKQYIDNKNKFYINLRAIRTRANKDKNN